MSGNVSSTTSSATSGFQMNSSVESQLNADATSFDSLVGQGASTQQQTAAAETLDNDLNQDLVQSFGSNSSGLNDTSRYAMANDANQLEAMMGDVGSSGSASALQQFAKMIEAATNEGETSTSALSSPDSGTTSSTTGSDQSGTMQMMQEMLQMLSQAITMMQGGQTGSSAGDASTSPSSGAGSWESLQAGDAGSQPASTSGMQVTGNVSQDAQTLMSLVGGVGTNGDTLGSFASALGKEAASQGNSAVANWANNLAGSLGNGTYDQQGSLSAGTAAMQGKGVDSVQNNLSAILTQLESGQSTGSIANNLNALSTELKDAGKSGLANQMSSLASGLQNGSVSDSQGAAMLQMLQMLSKLGLGSGTSSAPAATSDTSSAATPTTATTTAADPAAVTPGTTFGIGPVVNNNGTKQLEQMMQMLEQMMMEMTQMMQGGLSQAA